jgi:hypothetical protein
MSSSRVKLCQKIAHRAIPATVVNIPTAGCAYCAASAAVDCAPVIALSANAALRREVGDVAGLTCRQIKKREAVREKGGGGGGVGLRMGSKVERLHHNATAKWMETRERVGALVLGRALPD